MSLDIGLSCSIASSGNHFEHRRPSRSLCLAPPRDSLSPRPRQLPIEDKESFRWLENVRQSTRNLGDATRCVHIGDRESDIYELFSECESQETKFVFRTCVNRRCGEGEQTVTEVMKHQRVKAIYRVEVRDRDAPPGNIVLWRGMTRLTDIYLGFTLAKNVGH